MYQTEFRLVPNQSEKYNPNFIQKYIQVQFQNVQSKSKGTFQITIQKYNPSTIQSTIQIQMLIEEINRIQKRFLCVYVLKKV